ncbi:MAG: hypothetical protein EPN57_20500 [Paraburkholderia sp.]|nr:MAG: hypothetical protein EPN57_20500 [Paraburkholderia sp.]
MNIDTILADIKRVRDEIERSAPTVRPMRLLESELCVRNSDRPRRVHHRRRGMTAAYHHRIQKKWVKRFGFELEYTAYQIDPSAMGMPGEPYLCVHPVIAMRMRARGVPAPSPSRSHPLSPSQRDLLGLWL